MEVEDNIEAAEKYRDIHDLVFKGIITRQQAAEIIEEKEQEANNTREDIETKILRLVSPQVLASWIATAAGGIEYRETSSNRFLVRCPSPRHPDVNPSCQVEMWDHKANFKCHSPCGVDGDVFDWVKLSGNGETRREQINYIKGLLNF